MLGLPSEVYRYGAQYWLAGVTLFLVCLTIGFVHVPLYTRLKLTSCYQASIHLAWTVRDRPGWF